MMDKKRIQTKAPVPNGRNDRLVKARKARGWVQQEVANQLGVSLNAVRTWERGSRFPSLRWRVRLSELYGLSLAELDLEAPEDAEETEAPFEEEQQLPGRLERRRERINRRRMIDRVRAIWMNILDQSLQKAALIALSLQDLPAALENPWCLALPQSNRSPQPFPAGTSILQVFDEANGDVLILGEPGSGKTTLLLELARSLLRRAEQQEDEALPVVFPLSSWVAKQQELGEWLVEELWLKYHVPPRVGEEWVQQETLMLLLDGLDEVAEDARAACIQAINRFKTQHEIVPVVICCRLFDYFATETYIRLRQAVQILPLTMDQIEDYLSSMGKQLGNVRTALKEDVDLQEMAQSPLMLSILTLTYRGLGKACDGLLLKGTCDERRQQVLQQYIQRLLARRVESNNPNP